MKKITISVDGEYLDSKEIEAISDIFPKVMEVKSKLDDLPDDLQDGVLFASIMVLIGADYDKVNNDAMIDAFNKLLKLKEGK